MEILNIINNFLNLCFLLIGTWIGISFLVNQAIKFFCKHKIKKQIHTINKETGEVNLFCFCSLCGKKLIPYKDMEL